MVFNGASRTRTGDLLGAIQALSQLSYSPVERMVICWLAWDLPSDPRAKDTLSQGEFRTAPGALLLVDCDRAHAGADRHSALRRQRLPAGQGGRPPRGGVADRGGRLRQAHRRRRGGRHAASRAPRTWPRPCGRGPLPALGDFVRRAVRQPGVARIEVLDNGGKQTAVSGSGERGGLCTGRVDRGGASRRHPTRFDDDRRAVRGDGAPP